MNSFLHIGAVQSVAIQLLPGWIRRFRIAHPHTAIKLYEGTSPEVTGWTLADVVEVGIASQVHPSLNRRTIYEGDFVVVVPANHKFLLEKSISLESLNGERMLISNDGCETLIEEHLAAAAIYPEIICSVRDITTLISMVREGLGLTIIPEFSLPSDRDGVQPIRLHSNLQYKLYMLTKFQKIHEPTAMTFIGLVGIGSNYT